MEEYKKNKEEDVPPAIELEENEKFKDVDGNVIDLIVVGEKKIDSCYFEASSVALGFNLPRLVDTITDKRHDGYRRNVHYRYFTNADYKNKVFLTYLGLSKVADNLYDKYDTASISNVYRWLSQFIGNNSEEYMIDMNQPSVHNSKGFTYCITSDVIDGVKIGYWTGTIESLQKRYQTYYGKNTELFYVKTNKPKKLEKKCHKHFRNYNITGEIFKKKYWSKYVKYLKKKKEIFKNNERISDLELKLMQERYDNAILKQELERSKSSSYSKFSSDGVQSLVNKTPTIGIKKISVDKILKYVDMIPPIFKTQ